MFVYVYERTALLPLEGAEGRGPLRGWQPRSPGNTTLSPILASQVGSGRGRGRTPPSPLVSASLSLSLSLSRRLPGRCHLPLVLSRALTTSGLFSPDKLINCSSLLQEALTQVWRLNQRLGRPHQQMSSLTSTPAPCLPGSSHHLVATGDSMAEGKPRGGPGGSARGWARGAALEGSPAEAAPISTPARPRPDPRRPPGPPLPRRVTSAQETPDPPPAVPHSLPLAWPSGLLSTPRHSRSATAGPAPPRTPSRLPQAPASRHSHCSPAE